MIINPGDIVNLNIRINLKNDYNENINIPIEYIEYVISNLIVYYTGQQATIKLNNTYFKREIFKEKFTTKSIKRKITQQ